MDTLSERLALLSVPRKNDNLESSNEMVPSAEMVQALPPEVLMLIFSFLDDISLYSVGNVCSRWHQLLVSQTTSEQWQIYTRKRWPLFRPLCRITDWFGTYSSLVSKREFLVVPENVENLSITKYAIFYWKSTFPI